MTRNSMTGFARADGQCGDTGWVWELRSVNGRGLELRWRLPQGLEAIESSLREAAARALKRGSVQANLTLRREARPGASVDRAALDQMLALALELAARIPGAAAPRAENLLALPGVFRATTESDGIAPALREAVIAGFATALHRLAEARGAEGERLASVLDAQLDAIAALKSRAQTEAASQAAAHFQRLSDQIANLLAASGHADSLPPERLAQEVALLTVRSDVREELDRLDSHLEAARALLAAGGAVGRQLDFLVQEFVRETNTLCSKSATKPLTAIGLEMKSVIEQLREQVQNFE